MCIWPTEVVHTTYKKCTSDLQLMVPSDLQKVYIRPTKSVHMTYKKCISDLQKVYIEPKKVYIRPTKSVHSTYENCKSELQKVYIRPKTIKVYISDLKKGISLPFKSTCSMQHKHKELYHACIGRIKEKKMCNRPTAVVGREISWSEVQYRGCCI